MRHLILLGCLLFNFNVFAQTKENVLQEEIKLAYTVIIGRVSVVSNDILNLGKPVFSEHASMWKIAAVRVDSLLFGDISGVKTVMVVFDASIDVANYQKPKLEEGQKSIFILRFKKIAGEKYLTLENSAQVQPLSKKEVIGSLVFALSQKIER